MHIPLFFCTYLPSSPSLDPFPPPPDPSFSNLPPRWWSSPRLFPEPQIHPALLSRLPSDRPPGKYVVVAGINPTPLGEGTTIHTLIYTQVPDR